MQLQNGIVTTNGAAAADSYHVGHLVLDFFNKPEDFVWQIDAGTGEVENKSSVKSRSVQLAKCLRNAGFKPGDVIAVSGINHLDVHIPFYAGYFNGHPIMGIDPSYRYDEVKRLFEITNPKVTFVEVGLVEEYEKVINDLGLDTRIITFGDSDRSLAKFIRTYDDGAPDSEFRVATIDTSKVYAWLVLTSGTTGLPKVAAFKHSDIITMIKINSAIKDKEMAPLMLLPSVQWVSSYLATLCTISANQIKLQSSTPVTVEHIIEIINKYKPVAAISTPLVINEILKHEKHCDLTCFKRLVVTAFAMNPVTLNQLKEYFNNPEATQAAISDGWLRTGDLLYRDEKGYFFYVERISSSFRYRNYFITPLELEHVIQEHPDVLDVCVVGVPHPEDNKHAVACVMRRPGSTLTEQAVKDIISNVLDVCVVGMPHPEDYKHAVECAMRRPGSTLTEQGPVSQ
ncbi:medium/long-chain-fatty-acid--CoA ligase FadD8-like [Cydia amplana]|uniref:medium/long-chain-fatty-acid--CoA ligase FadD8-like n=1 Tax=Cydia amplana TaxID=1869771 RepID=UPI002FE57C0F